MPALVGSLAAGREAGEASMGFGPHWGWLAMSRLRLLGIVESAGLSQQRAAVVQSRSQPAQGQPCPLTSRRPRPEDRAAFSEAMPDLGFRDLSC